MSASGSIITGQRFILKSNPISTLVLQSPDLTKFVFSIVGGALVSNSGAAGTVSDIKVTGGSDSEASFAVTNNGEIQVKNGIDLSGTATLDNDYRMKSIADGKIYRLAVSASDEIKLIEV